MKHECHCHDSRKHGECECGYRHDRCGCGCEENDTAAVNAMFGFDDSVPEDALTLLRTELNECDDLAELLGVGRNPDVDDLLEDAIADLSPKKKKTLMNLAIILHDYLPDD